MTISEIVYGKIIEDYQTTLDNFLGKMLHDKNQRIDYFAKKNFTLREVTSWNYNHKSRQKASKPSKLINMPFPEILLRA